MSSENPSRNDRKAPLDGGDAGQRQEFELRKRKDRPRTERRPGTLLAKRNVQLAGPGKGRLNVAS